MQCNRFTVNRGGGGEQGEQLLPHQQLGGENISFCSPKNFEGPLNGGRSAIHHFLLKV